MVSMRCIGLQLTVMWQLPKYLLKAEQTSMRSRLTERRRSALRFETITENCRASSWQTAESNRMEFGH